MKAPFRPETNFSCSNTGVLWPHNYFLKGAFYLERFSTQPVRLSRLLVHRLLLNNFYFAHNGSNNQGILQGVLQAQSASYTFTSACCSLVVVSPIGKVSVVLLIRILNKAPLKVRSNFFCSEQGAFADHNFGALIKALRYCILYSLSQSHKPHPSLREEGSGHAAAGKLSQRNT